MTRDSLSYYMLKRELTGSSLTYLMTSEKAGASLTY